MTLEPHHHFKALELLHAVLTRRPLTIPDDPGINRAMWLACAYLTAAARREGWQPAELAEKMLKGPWAPDERWHALALGLIGEFTPTASPEESLDDVKAMYDRNGLLSSTAAAVQVRAEMCVALAAVLGGDLKEMWGWVVSSVAGSMEVEVDGQPLADVDVCEDVFVWDGGALVRQAGWLLVAAMLFAKRPKRHRGGRGSAIRVHQRPASTDAAHR